MSTNTSITEHATALFDDEEDKFRIQEARKKIQETILLFSGFLASEFLPFIKMRRYAQRQNLTTLSEINITPLLDLAFVLLIIFIITTPLIENSLSLSVPSSAAAKAPVDPTKVQTVSIDRDEALRFNNEIVDMETLSARLTNAKAANPEVAIVVRPDRELPVQKLIALMDVLQRAQITKIGIATKTDSP